MQMEKLPQLTEQEINERIVYFHGLLSKYKTEFFMSIMLAQVGLESYWGESTLAKDANNFTGHKFKKPFSTARPRDYYIKDAGEEVGGKKVIDKDAKWRKYYDADDWARHHANWLTQSEWYSDYYKEAIEAKTPEEQAEALTETYATDSSYATQLMGIIRKYDLTKYDKEDNKMVFIGLDIGHGNNSGSRGNNGVGDEHKFNSIVGLKLKTLLEKAGHKVTFGVQQPHSKEVGLSARTKRFNQIGVDFVISIHANAFHNASVNGICGFFWHDHVESKKLCNAIMKQMETNGQRIYGTGSIASMVGSWTNLHMVRETRMTSVLMEYGFMTGNKDRYHIFGAGQDVFTTKMAELTFKGVQDYLGHKAVIQSYNPQGLDTIKTKPYQAPSNPFTKLAIGEEVTLSRGFYWYDIATKELMLSKKQKDLELTMDKIVEIKEIEGVEQSKIAYKLEKYNSWILEEHLEEAKPNEDEPVEDNVELEVIINGVRYVPVQD